MCRDAKHQVQNYLVTVDQTMLNRVETLSDAEIVRAYLEASMVPGTSDNDERRDRDIAPSPAQMMLCFRNGADQSRRLTDCPSATAHSIAARI